MSSETLENRFWASTRTARPGGLRPSRCTGPRGAPRAGNPRGGCRGVGQAAGGPWGGRQVGGRSAPRRRATWARLPWTRPRRRRLPIKSKRRRRFDLFHSGEHGVWSRRTPSMTPRAHKRVGIRPHRAGLKRVSSSATTSIHRSRWNTHAKRRATWAAKQRQVLAFIM